VNGKQIFKPLIQNILIDEEEVTKDEDDQGEKIKIIKKRPSPVIQQFQLDKVYFMNWFNNNDMEFNHYWQNTQSVLNAYYHHRHHVWEKKKEMKRLSNLMY